MIGKRTKKAGERKKKRKKELCRRGKRDEKNRVATIFQKNTIIHCYMFGGTCAAKSVQRGTLELEAKNSKQL